MRRLLTALFFCGLGICVKAQFQGLVVNEFSQGASGSREYIELVVVGVRTCTDSVADIRGWILDDQNGWYGTSNGAPGHYRFKDHPTWAAVPFGAIIVLYNADDPNASMPPNDHSDNNGDLSYIVNIPNSNLIEQNAAQPTNVSGVGYTYPPTSATYAAVNNQWSFIIALNNSGGDVINVVNPVDRANASFSVGFGYTVLPGFRNPMVSIPNVGGGNCARLTNSNYTDAASWAIAPVAGNETPGQPNGGANTTWIQSMRLGRPKIVADANAASVCFSSSQQLSSLAYGFTHHSPTHYSINWNGSPVNSFASVPSTPLPIGSIPVTVPPNTGAGTYTGNLTVSNATGNSCATVPFSITVYAPPVVSAGNYGPLCVNSAPISLSGTPAGGSFSGTGVSGNSFIPPSVAGIYSITYTYSDPGTGCSNTATSTITVDALPAMGITPASAPVCPGSSVTLTANGAAAYSWSPSSGLSANTGATVSANPSVTTTYTVTGTAGACSNSASVTVTVLLKPPTPFVQVFDPTCTTPGSLLVFLQASYTYSINGVDYLNNNGVFDNLAPANYTVTVKNSDGCISDPVNVTVNPPPGAPAAPVVATVQPTCSQPLGSVTVSSPAEGTGYSYSIDNANYVASSSFVNLAPGVYNVWVKNPGGCVSAGTSFTISAAPPAPVAPTVSVVNNCDGTATVTASGVVGNLTWSNGATGNPVVINTTGNYSVIQTVNGCASASAPFAVNIVAPPPVSAGSYADLCLNAPAINLNGVPAGGVFSGTGVAGNVFTPSISGVFSITYAYQVGSCTYTAATTINVRDTPRIGVTPDSSHRCVNGPGVVLTATGGVNYSWTPSTGLSAATGSVVVATPQGQTIYEVVGRDANGCSARAIAKVQVTAFLDAPAYTLFQPDCSTATGSLLVTQTAGTTPLQWSLDGINFSTQQNYLSLQPGTYTLYQRDSITGCSSSSTGIVIFPQPLLAAPTVSVTQPTCSNASGSIAVDVVANALYSIDGVNYVSSNLFTGLAPGNYNVTVKNSGGCVSAAMPAVVNAAGGTVINSLSVCIGEGQTYNFNGQQLALTGNYTASFPRAGTCDSLVNLHLIVATRQTQNVSGCGSVVFNGNTYTTSTVLRDTLRSASGCDSVFRMTDITVNLPVVTQLSACIGAGEVYNFNGQSLTQSGSYTATYPAVNGCDSIVQLQLLVTRIQNQPVNGCGTVTYNGNVYTSPSILRDTVRSRLTGCDSIINIVNINVQPLAQGSTTACIATGQSFNFNGQQLSTAGWHSAIIARPGQCDSIAKLYLTISRQEIQTVANCGPVFYNGNVYPNSTTVYDTLKSSISGCDSIHRVIRILVQSQSVSSIVACLAPGQSYQLGSRQLTLSGLYTATLTSIGGCDSVVNLYLVVASEEVVIIIGCEKVVYEGVEYTSSTVLQRKFVSQLTGCDSVFRKINITVNPKPQLQLSGNTIVCKGQPAVLQAVSNGTIEWLNTGTGSIITVGPLVTTTYSAVAHSNGCTDTANITVTVSDFNLQLEASSNPAIAGTSVVLRSSANSVYQVIGWSPSLFSNNSAPVQQLVADNSVTVTVIARSPDNCIDSATVILAVDGLSDLYLPSAFTPDGDGKNDFFKVLGGNIEKMDLRVMNRWGGIVFASKDRFKGWDGTISGKPQPSGVFVYVLKATLKNGKEVNKKGTVMLIR